MTTISTEADTQTLLRLISWYPDNAVRQQALAELASLKSQLEQVQKERDENADRSLRNFKDAQSAFGALGYGQENKHDYRNYVADKLRAELAQAQASAAAMSEAIRLTIAGCEDDPTMHNGRAITEMSYGDLRRLTAALSKSGDTPRNV